MTPAFAIGTVGISWLDAGPSAVSATVAILAGLLCATALSALAVLRMVFLQRQKLAEADQARRLQAAAAQALLDALPFPVMLRDASGAYSALNAACLSRLGIDPAQAVGHTSLELRAHRLLPLADGTPVAPWLQQIGQDVQRSDKVQRGEVGYLSGDGRQRAGLLLEAPLHSANGQADGSVGMLLDITEYRQIELSARATEQSLREITQRIPVVVFAVRRGNDRLQRLAFIAGNLQALFGLAPADLLEDGDVLRDWPFHDRIHAEDAPALRRLLQRAARHMRTSTLDFRAYGADGLRWIHLVMGMRRLPEHGIEWIGYFIDTTSINAHNEALRAARDAAERASKAKADFLATMSHEIRTPMNGVVGMLELLAHTSLNPEQTELVHAVEDSAGVLMQVLNDVLDFSKLEAGNLRLDHAPFDMRTLIDNVVGMMSGAMHKKGLQIEIDADATLAGRLYGDSVRIRQILLNLLNNAGKFTERGSVAVGVRVLGDDGHAQRLRISVTDTGIGIAADKQANLFTPFSQAESWTTRRYGGTGLGLAICRHLVQLMDGSIALSSRLGEGTKVTLELRLPVAQREIDRPAGLAGRHAVVRLESPSVAAALTAHLTALGLTVEHVSPTQPMRRGIAANLLFVDAGDRESAGLIAAQAVLVDTVPGGSGDPPAADEESIRLNANPLKWQAVSRVCAQALEPLAPPAPAIAPRTDADRAPASTRPRENGRILIAEDHPVSQNLVRRQLALLGWSCEVVGDGRAAYEALCSGTYRMLMTDCQMPLMNGYELAAAWRRHESETGSARLPVIAMTANALDGEIQRCREAGMDDYLSKPVQLRQLEAKIRSWIAPRAQPPAAPAPDDVFAEPGMQAMRQEMLRMLMRTSDDDLRMLERAAQDGDNRQATLSLHRMLGALQLFGAGPTVTQGRILLEELAGADAGHALERMPAYLEMLKETLAELAHEAGHA